MQVTGWQSKLEHAATGVFALLAMFASPAASAATFTVNVSGDAADAAIDGICEAQVGGANCTLRAAIQESNASAPVPGPTHAIAFGIPQADPCFVVGIDHCAIAIGSELPDIVRPVVIDGSTQPGNAAVCSTAIENRPAYLIVLDGGGFFGAKLRLEQGSDGSTIRGLNLQRMTDAIAIIRSDNNTIACNFIGTDHLGGSAGTPGGSLNGIILGCDSSANTIGGAGTGDGNLISGSTGDGIQINGDIPCVPANGTPDGNFVLGNSIGTLKDGATPFANGAAGISMFAGTGPDDNLVGIKPDGAGGFLRAANVISGNANDGIYIGEAVSGAVIAGNIIGADSGGTLAAGNGLGAIYSAGGPGILIGGPTAADANILAFNTFEGVAIDTMAVGNRIQGNRMFGNGTLGIDLGLDGVTANDAGDADAGANTLLNYPEILLVQPNGANVSITYRIPVAVVAPDLPLQVEFFVADADQQEGEFLIGTDVYAAAGTKTISLPVGPFVAGDAIVATASNTAGNTSEFTADRIFANGFD